MKRIALAAALILAVNYGLAQDAPNFGGLMVPNSAGGGGSSSLVPGTTAFACGSAGSFAYSDGTLLQCDANLKVTTPSTSVGNVSILGGGATVPQFTFVPNSGNAFSWGMSNAGGQLIGFANTTAAVGFGTGGVVIPLNASFGFSTSAAVNSSLSAIMTSSAAGIISADTTAGNNGLGQLRSAVYRGSGAVPTGNTGTCSTGVTVAGGASVGTWTSTAICALAGTIILTAMPTQTTGYVCDMADRTTQGVVIEETATTATTVTFTVRSLPTGTVATVANDILQYKCMGY